jgi:hypothetical protein
MFDKWKLDEKGFHFTTNNKIKRFTKKHPKLVRDTRLYQLWEKDPELLRKELFE